MKKIRVMHLITGLKTGGAEHMLLKVLSRSDRSRFDHDVVTMTPPGPVAPLIEAVGVKVRSLEMRKGVPGPRALARLYRWLASERPDVLQTWMLHADLLGSIAGWAARVPVVWNIRHGALEPSVTPLLTRLTERTCALLSKPLPRRIVCCAEESRRHQLAVGYDKAKLLVIPNGFDTESFRPDPAARASVRAELGIPENALVVGVMARFDPYKDHAGFLQAAALVHAELPEVHFVLCGRQVDERNPAVASLVASLGLGKVTHLLGSRSDIARICAALDVLCSSSISESFPNVLGEAMSCGVPCVVTDAGDSALIVGDTGRVVAPREPEALARGLVEVLTLEPAGHRQLGERARRRILQLFDLPLTVARYEALYREVACAA